MTTFIKIFYFKEISFEKETIEKVLLKKTFLGLNNKYETYIKKVDTIRYGTIQELTERINKFTEENKLEILQFETIIKTALDVNLKMTDRISHRDNFKYFNKLDIKFYLKNYDKFNVLFFKKLMLILLKKIEIYNV